MNTKLKVTQSITAVLALLILAQPVHADSRKHNDHDRRDRYSHDRNDWHSSRHYPPVHHYRSYPHSSIVFRLPHTFITLSFGGLKFFYCDGIYYRRVFGHYEAVRPPIGVVINRLPEDYERVAINGHPYYLCNGSYYKNTGRGYVVVSDPNLSRPQNVTRSSSPGNNDLEFITLNIPNHKGGYTAVMLKRSGQGFIGPQGELYEEFPSVEQLKVVYGK